MPTPTYRLRLSTDQRAAIEAARKALNLKADADVINAALEVYLGTLKIDYPATRQRGGDQRKALPVLDSTPEPALPKTWFITELQDALKRASKVEWDARYITITENLKSGAVLIMVIEKQPDGTRWEQSKTDGGKLYNCGNGKDSTPFESLIPMMQARHRDIMQAARHE